MDKMSDYETGRLDERKYIVCRMHYNKIEHTDIVRYTGVSLDDIEQWVKEDKINNFKKYRVNPFCPHCGEEHGYYDIELSEEDQKTLLEYYKQNIDKSRLELLIRPAPVMVQRGFTCVACRKPFEARVPVRLEDSIAPNHLGSDLGNIL